MSGCLLIAVSCVVFCLVLCSFQSADLWRRGRSRETASNFCPSYPESVGGVCSASRGRLTLAALGPLGFRGTLTTELRRMQCLSS